MGSRSRSSGEDSASEEDLPLANTPRLASDPTEPDADPIEEANSVASFFTVFYNKLVRGYSVSEAHRLAMLDLSRSWAMFPWAWGSFSVMGHGGLLEGLASQCKPVVASYQRLQGYRGRIRAVAASSEALYLSSMNIPAIYEGILQTILASRPDSELLIMDAMINHLLESVGRDGEGAVLPKQHLTLHPPTTAADSSETHQRQESAAAPHSPVSHPVDEDAGKATDLSPDGGSARKPPNSNE